MLAIPSNSKMEDLSDLRGQTVGIVGGEINRQLVSALFPGNHTSRTGIRFKDLAIADAAQALKSKSVDALLVTAPITERYRAALRGFFEANGKQQPKVLAIDDAEAVANANPAYESYELPKGSLRGVPPVPDEDLSTLRVTYYILAQRSVSDDTATALAKGVMDTKRAVAAAEPLLAHIAAPSTDADAFIPVHPGAAAFFNGEVQGFFDKYGNQLFYGPMLLGALMSALAAAWKFMGLGGRNEAGPMDALISLADRASKASSPTELDTLENEVDTVLLTQLAALRGSESSPDAGAIALAAHRLEQLIRRRKTTLMATHGPPTAAL